MEALQKSQELAEWQTQKLRDYLKVKSSIDQDEAAVVLANTAAPTIRHLFQKNDPEIKDRFKELIAAIAVISGSREVPDQILLNVLWDYFKTDMQGFTFEDVRLAFKMNASGKFGDRIQHFQLLDISFISQVMDAYLEEKIKVATRIKTLLKPAPEYVESEKESYDGLIVFVKKTGEFPLVWSWQKVYDYMMDIGLIRETKDERWNLYNQEMERLSDSIASDATQISFIESRSRREKLPELAKMNCIKKLIQKHLPK